MLCYIHSEDNVLLKEHNEDIMLSVFFLVTVLLKNLGLKISTYNYLSLSTELYVSVFYQLLSHI